MSSFWALMCSSGKSESWTAVVLHFLSQRITSAHGNTTNKNRAGMAEAGMRNPDHPPPS